VPELPEDLTTLIVRMRKGDAAAGERAMGAVYAEIHKLARHYMRSENANNTLQPTALVNEAYLRLMKGPTEIADRHHFFALAAQAMRRALVDHARKKRSDKRGGGAVALNLEDLHVASPSTGGADILAVNEALEALAKLDPAVANVIELRYFGGHTDKEVAEILGQSLATVRRHWEFGRSWLQHRMESAQTPAARKDS
jgi:RNA polymerase sigma-70 factor, ECF subfamily